MRPALAFAASAAFSVVLLLTACPGDGGSLYCCAYESRSTGCGGVGWSDWAAESFTFNIDDYIEGWTPEQVCGKFSGSDTECSATCCIDVEYRSNTLSGGACGG
jgi:hypothetical protein